LKVLQQLLSVNNSNLKSKKMKRIFTAGSLAALLFVASVVVVSCTGEDGDPGTAGTDGTNGVGFDESLSKGNVVVILDGKRPDGVAFKDTIDFRYAPSDLGSSALTKNGDSEDQYTRIYLDRYQSIDGRVNDINGVNVWGGSRVDGNNNTSTYSELDLDDVVIEFPADHKYFYLNTDFYWEKYYSEGVEEYTNMTNPVLSGYTYDVATTGKIGFKLTGVVPAEENSTGYDLTVIAVVDASVYQQMESIEPDNGRVGSKKTTSNGKASAKVMKAEMKSMN
jgi:hypothetical protein